MKESRFNAEFIITYPDGYVHGGPGSGRYPKGSGGNESSAADKVPDDVKTAMAGYLEGMKYADKVAEKFPEELKTYADQFLGDDGDLLQMYLWDGFSDFNNHLREPPGDLIRKANAGAYNELDDNVAAIADVIADAPFVPAGTVMYRGVGVKSGKILADKPIGSICEDPAFQSHTIDPHVAENFAKMWEPTKGDYHQTIVRAISDGAQHGVYVKQSGQVIEHELLLQKGSRWKVVGKDEFKLSSEAQKGEPWETTTVHVITVVPAGGR